MTAIAGSGRPTAAHTNLASMPNIHLTHRIEIPAWIAAHCDMRELRIIFATLRTQNIIQPNPHRTSWRFRARVAEQPGGKHRLALRKKRTSHSIVKSGII